VYSEEAILQKIISLNSSSEHPLAQATLRFGEEKQVEIKPVSEFEAITGKGVTGVLEGKIIALGNSKLMEQSQVNVSEELKQQVIAEQKLG
jgi:cation transport ATPase